MLQICRNLFDRPEKREDDMTPLERFQHAANMATRVATINLAGNLAPALLCQEALDARAAAQSVTRSGLSGTAARILPNHGAVLMLEDLATQGIMAPSGRTPLDQGAERALFSSLNSAARAAETLARQQQRANQEPGGFLSAMREHAVLGDRQEDKLARFLVVRNTMAAGGADVARMDGIAQEVGLIQGGALPTPARRASMHSPTM